MKAREIGNAFLHFGLGGLIAFGVCWSHWLLIPATFIYAWLREQGQHRYVFGPAGVEKSTFFGWVTWHRMIEVLEWTIGAAVACIVWEFI